MNHIIRNIFFVLFVLSWVSCAKSDDFSVVPYLEFQSFSKQEMIQGNNQQDSVTMVLYFTDGDGDFGSDTGSNEANVFIKDLRTGETFREYKAPMVPVEGTGNGISGTIRIRIYTTCCIFDPMTGIPPCEPSTTFPTNPLPLEVYIMDRAGNKSNVVQADVLTLRCE